MSTDDASLTETGLTTTGDNGRILLIACGALAREILALKAQNGWDHMDLTCLPAKYHLFPDKIVPDIRKLVQKHRDDYDDIFVVFADCGTGGQLKSACDELGINMIAGPHCYAFYEGTEQFVARAEDEIDVFYLTDFLVRQFEAFIIKPMGLDRHPELRDMYFGNYRKLIYLAQLDDPELDRKARDAADYLALDYERRLTGYGDLKTALSGL